MLVKVLVAEYLSSLAGRGLSVSYGKTEGVILKVFARWWGRRPVVKLSAQALYAFAGELRKTGPGGRKLTDVTIRRYCRSVAQFGHWLYRREYCPADPSDGFELAGKPDPGIRQVPSAEQMEGVLDAIGESRDRALFELMYSSGLRITEALNLETSDVKLEERTLLVRWGKGKKDRYVPFSHAAQRWLLRYLQTARVTLVAAVKEDQRRFLFLHSEGQLSWKVAADRWKDAVKAAGLGGKGYSLHSIRHACATGMLENGADIRYVQELLGHESLSTTQIYTRLNKDKIKAAYRSHHPRENQQYVEVSQEYRREVARLKEELEVGKREYQNKVDRRRGSRET